MNFVPSLVSIYPSTVLSFISLQSMLLFLLLPRHLGSNPWSQLWLKPLIDSLDSVITNRDSITWNCCTLGTLKFSYLITATSPSIFPAPSHPLYLCFSIWCSTSHCLIPSWSHFCPYLNHEPTAILALYSRILLLYSLPNSSVAFGFTTPNPRNSHWPGSSSVAPRLIHAGRQCHSTVVCWLGSLLVKENVSIR